MSRVKVMIIDNSAVARQVIRETLAREPDMEVVGAAADPLFAWDRMQKDWPDVITLDLETPRMDGIAFLKKIMAERPTPVVVCASSATAGSAAARAALAAGAVSVLAKPQVGIRDFLQEVSGDVVAAVRAAARRTPTAQGGGDPSRAAAARLSADVVLPGRLPASPQVSGPSDAIVAIGTSTGGTQALEVVLAALPAACPGIVVVQHMPESFTALFAQRLNEICRIEVREGATGDRVLPGRALIAPGGRHMLVHRNVSQYVVEVRDGPYVNRHKPSVDVLFRSVAIAAGRNALGVIMTGMGDDGARGLLELHDAGARTIAQDEATCIVYGMPKEAVKLGAVDRVLPLDQIAREVMAFAGAG